MTTPESMESFDDLITAVSLSHEYKIKEAQLQSTNNEINKLEQEVAKLRLEKEWCFDAEGNRIFPTAEEQAVTICEELDSHPELLEDTVKALRMKRIDLLCNLKELEQRCGQMKEEIKKLL